MTLTKEQIESMHTLLVRERPMGTSVAAVDELCRLALLGLEHDRIVAEQDARPDISAVDAAHAVQFFRGWDTPGSVADKVFSALRAHARKAAKP